MKRHQIAVLGGSGFIGRYVVKRLVERGEVLAVGGRHAATAKFLKLKMPGLEQAVAYWNDADVKLGKGSDHTEIFRYAEMLAENEG